MPKVIPPVLFIVAAVLMLFIHQYWPAVQLISAPYRLFGLPVLAVGLGVSAWHKQLFKRLGTNFNTFAEPGILVTEGMFRFSRNPMYLGFAIALLGLFVLLGSLTPLIIVLGFIIITDRWYIRIEEKAMLHKFGNQYFDYKKRVRRWL